jgi:hypothetical protein
VFSLDTITISLLTSALTALGLGKVGCKYQALRPQRIEISMRYRGGHIKAMKPDESIKPSGFLVQSKVKKIIPSIINFVTTTNQHLLAQKSKYPLLLHQLQQKRYS